MIKGKVHKYGSNVDTDVIIPARYLNTTDPKELASHCMEDIDAEFVKTVSPAISSSPRTTSAAGRRASTRRSRSRRRGSVRDREHLTRASSTATRSTPACRYWSARRLSRVYPMATRSRSILKHGKITNVTTGKTYQAKPFPPFMRELIEVGGLVNYTKAKLSESLRR